MLFKKNLITDCERYFYNFFRDYCNANNLELIPQVPLAAIVNKKKYNKKTPNELYRIIDFGIFTKDYKELILLIEINDHTHTYFNRRMRDNKVKYILNEANINLITFYTNKTNSPEYIYERLKTEIEKYFNNKSI